MADLIVLNLTDIHVTEKTLANRRLCVGYKNLVEHIGTYGQLCPITVKRHEEGWYQIDDGYGRYAALKQLGCIFITCHLLTTRVREKSYTIQSEKKYLSDGPFEHMSKEEVTREAILAEMTNKPYFCYRLDKDGYIEFKAVNHFRYKAKQWKEQYHWYIGRIN